MDKLTYKGIFRDYFKPILIITLSTLLSAFCSTYPITVLRDIIDKLAYGYGDYNVNKLIQAIISFILLQGFGYILNDLIRMFYYLTSSEIAYGIRKTLHSAMMKFYQSFFDNNDSAFVTGTIIQDTEIFAQCFLSVISNMFKFFFNFVFGFYYMWTISPVITLIELPLSLCAALISKLSGNKFKELSKENRKKNTLLWKTLQQHVKSSKEIHVYSLEEEKKSEFDVASCSMRTNMKSTARYSFKVSLLNNLSFVMIIAVVLLIGFYLVDNYGLSIGSLVAFFTYNSLLTTPFKNLIGILQEKQKMNVSLTRINQLLQNEQDNAYCCVAKDESIRLDINSPLALNSLSFSYDNYKNVVNHINLDSKTGGFYAFVGRTGCGKSTILKLIAGLYGGYTGVVSVLGNVMKDDNKLLLRKEMSFVFQDNYIFDGTIRENIIISNRDVDNESFERAVYCACVEDIVRKVPGGFDAIVGEEGMKLSGGERQRIGLARALILNRRILLLDEATSALDNDTESLVMNRIRENYPDLTCFVVAHRLTSIKKADCIFVMSEGRIVDYGNDEYLRKNSKCYMELVNAGN